MTRAARAKRPFSLLVWSSVVASVPLLGLSLVFEGTGRWQRGVFGRCVRDRCSRLRRHRLDVFRLRRLVLADVALPSVDGCSFTLLVPVVAILTSSLVRGEHPTWGELLGSLIVLVGLGLALGVVDALAVHRRTAARAVTPIS